MEKRQHHLMRCENASHPNHVTQPFLYLFLVYYTHSASWQQLSCGTHRSPPPRGQDLALDCGINSDIKQPGEVLGRDAGALDTVLLVEPFHGLLHVLQSHTGQRKLQIRQPLLRVKEEISRY